MRGFLRDAGKIILVTWDHEIKAKVFKMGLFYKVFRVGLFNKVYNGPALQTTFSMLLNAP